MPLPIKETYKYIYKVYLLATRSSITIKEPSKRIKSLKRKSSAINIIIKILLTIIVENNLY